MADDSNFSLEPVLTLRRVLGFEQKEQRDYPGKKTSARLKVRNSTKRSLYISLGLIIPEWCTGVAPTRLSL